MSQLQMPGNHCIFHLNYAPRIAAGFPVHSPSYQRRYCLQRIFPEPKTEYQVHHLLQNHQAEIDQDGNSIQFLPGLKNSRLNDVVKRNVTAQKACKQESDFQDLLDSSNLSSAWNRIKSKLKVFSRNFFQKNR